MRPPAGFVKQLRALADAPSLRLMYAGDEAEEKGHQVWKVFAVDCGMFRLALVWEHQLDGNLEAMATALARHDFIRNGGRRKYFGEIQARMDYKRRDRERRRKDAFRGVADHMKGAFRAMANGEASVGAR